MYDYFAFVLANNLDWTSPPMNGLPSVLDSYRDWSIGHLELDPSTVNQRIGVIQRFYLWALKQRLIGSLPFEIIQVRISREPGFPSCADSASIQVESSSAKAKARARQIKILTKEQVAVCRDALFNLNHRLMFELMVRTGLRQIECRTFPEKYVFDPSRHIDLQPGEKIRLYLDSKDMALKGGKSRGIDMPYDLMEDLWAYSVRHRQKRQRNNKKHQSFPTLFLTEGGVPYEKKSVTEVFAALSRRVEIRVTAHMLRHTYATYLLFSLRKSDTFEGEPLIYVADRLGHANLVTTRGYLHLVNSLEGQLILAHEDELDEIFNPEPT
ncbi:tyrosine-type recombinase/integrase [Paucimonas lemoignei]|nr:site-specific integrase [Paucimonas lemoignei]